MAGTINDVAKIAGVSSTTVSHVINNTRFVSEDVRNRVLQAMKELGYKRNYLARSLRRGKTSTIGMIMPDSSNPFFAEIAHDIEDYAFRRGYSVILCNTEGDPEKELFYIDLLYQKQVDGMIFIAAGENEKSIKFIIDNDIDVVIIDRELYSDDHTQFPKVLVDNESGGYLATKHLIDIGHRRIVCICGPSFLTPSAERESGYQRALKEADIPFDESLIIRGEFHTETGYHAFKQLQSISPAPTAVFASNDLIAIGLIYAAQENGIRVPDDLSVVGFDDIKLASYISPSITTIRQPINAIAQNAMDNLLNILNNKEVTFEIRLPVELIIRGSTKAINE